MAILAALTAALSTAHAAGNADSLEILPQSSDGRELNESSAGEIQVLYGNSHWPPRLTVNPDATKPQAMATARTARKGTLSEVRFEQKPQMGASMGPAAEGRARTTSTSEFKEILLPHIRRSAISASDNQTQRTTRNVDTSSGASATQLISLYGAGSSPASQEIGVGISTLAFSSRMGATASDRQPASMPSSSNSAGDQTTLSWAGANQGGSITYISLRGSAYANSADPSAPARRTTSDHLVPDSEETLASGSKGSRQSTASQIYEQTQAATPQPSPTPSINPELAALQSTLGIRIFDVTEFGASADGVQDDTRAIQSAIDAAYNAGGGIVYLPAGTYLVGETKGPHFVLLRPRSNVHMFGDGDVSVIKAASQLNGLGRSFNVIRHVSDDSYTSIDNVSFRKFKIDCNGANNLVPQGEPNKDNVAIGISRGENILVESITVENNAGRQCLSFGNNTKPHSIANLNITSCTLSEVGSSVTGNIHQNDHSAIYAQSNGCIISNNLFRNSAIGKNTAIETHSSNASCTGNTIINYGIGFNIVATVTDNILTDISKNNLQGIERGFAFWCFPGMSMERITINQNTVVQESSFHPVIDLDSQAKSMIKSVTITDNHLSNTAPLGSNRGPGCRVGRVKSCTIERNEFRGIAGRAIEFGTLQDSELDLLISRNVIEDCGRTENASYRGGVILNSLSKIARLRILENSVRNTQTSGYMTQGIYGNAGVIDGEIRGNIIENILSTVGWSSSAYRESFVISN